MDAAAISFRMAEANRSKSVQGAVIANSARAAVTDPELADLIRRQQDADRQILNMEKTVLDLLASASDGQDAVVQKLREQYRNPA